MGNFVVDEVVIAVALKYFYTSCDAAVPSEPAPAWISTRCPRCTLPIMCNACQALKNDYGMAAAYVNE